MQEKHGIKSNQVYLANTIFSAMVGFELLECLLFTVITIIIVNIMTVCHTECEEV